jgi:hypothetical protein
MSWLVLAAIGLILTVADHDEKARMEFACLP